MKAIRHLLARLELVTDGQLFLFSVVWVVVAGLALQLVILPYVVPSSHWGHGLIANVDAPGFHMMAVETAQRMRLQGVFTDFGRWRDGTYNYPVAIASLFYLIYPEPWIQLPFNGVLFGITVVVIRRVLAELSESRGVALAALLPFFVFPSFAVIWGQPHRDLLTGTGFSLVLYSLVLAAYGSRDTAKLLWLAVLAIVGMGVIWISRPYALSLVAAGTVVFAPLAFFSKQCRRGRLVTLTATVLIAAFVNIKGWTEVRSRVDPSGVSPIAGAIPAAPGTRTPNPAASTPAPAAAPAPATPPPGPAGSSFGWRWLRLPRIRPVVSATARSTNCFPPSTGGADIFLYNLCHVREGSIASALLVGASSGYDYDVRIRSTEDFLAYAPRAVAFALLEPGPRRWGTERTTLGRLATLFVPFEMILAYVACGLALFVGRKRLARLNVWAVAAFCITYITIYAYATPQLGGLYRMRAFAFAIVVSTALAVALPAPAPAERGSESLH